jgi:hypothetical protein
MATKSSDSLPRKSGKSGAKVLGRSAATGKLILSPASKGSTGLVRDVTKAAESLRSMRE